MSPQGLGLAFTSSFTHNSSSILYNTFIADIIMMLLYLILNLCFAPVCWTATIMGVAVNNTLTLGFSLPWEHGWTVGPGAGAGIIVGIEEVHRRQLLPGYDIEWVFRDDHCEPQRGECEYNV